MAKEMDQVLAPATGLAVELAPGQKLKVTDLEGLQVVDMAVGVVSIDAPRQPKRLGDSEKATQRGFDVGPAPARIAIGVQQAGLSGEGGAGAVQIDRAPFEHHLGREPGQAERFGDPPRGGVVEVVRRILAAPGVVIEIHSCHAGGRRRITNYDCPVIPNPGVVGRDPEQSDAIGGHTPGELAFDATALALILNIDADELVRRQCSDELGHRLFRLPEHTGPGLVVVRPGYPG